jgi:hypothetical protein
MFGGAAAAQRATKKKKRPPRDRPFLGDFLARGTARGVFGAFKT